ncbi:MAG: ABC transporter permease [Burkholderiales bacterium]|nr:ABC transporter permease [Burkholderiales bacterium]
MAPPALPGYRNLAQRALTAGAWQENRGRLLLSVAGVALGVALGVAVHLINGSAITEFSLAARMLSGDADLVVRGPLEGFDEAIYPQLAQLPGVDVASPALEFDVRLPGRRALHLIAVDAFRALRIQPALFGSEFRQLPALLESDAVVLSRAAADDMGLREGDALVAQVGTQTVALRVVAVLAAAATAQRVAYADIATAQWRLQRLGLLDRIDIRIAPDADAAEVAARIAALLPPGVQVGDADAQSRQAEGMTRAYRVNLNMLALVALFTGSFLVFATQALTILRRRREIAILRVLGVTRGGVLRVLLAESLLLGAAGSALGVALGSGLAWLALTRLGGDLGAGYFSGMTVHLHQDPVVLALYFALGIAAALAGCIAPAWQAAASAPAPALKAGDASDTASAARPRWPGLVLLAAAVPLALLPPIRDLPLGGYGAVAALLAGALWLAPAVVEWLLGHLPAPRDAVALIAFQQLRGANSQLGISIAAIVVSFSLMAAMLIMIGSFRGSLEAWLEDILPADAYLRAGGAGQTGFLDAAALRGIATLPSVARTAAVRIQEVRMQPGQAPITLLARDIDPADPRALPQLQPGAVEPRGDLPPVWISEAAADLYGWRVGNEIGVALGGAAVRFGVAGIWRDYTRQNGTLLIDRARYVAATGDTRVNDVWVWLAPGGSVATLAAELRQAPGGAGLVDVRDAAGIRRVSLALFDRTFAVTYLLEAVAVLIGLFGISVGFSSQVLARRAEFGMLRHVGVTRRQIAALLGIEGLLAGATGIAYGLVTGGAISLILIHVVNRQSFHWSMDLHVPVLALAAVSAVLVLAATATAVASGRQAMSGQPIAAVKEDW